MDPKTPNELLLISSMLIVTALVLFTNHIQSDEMVHEFKNPSFSGIGTSSHYLTIENQKTNRKKALKEEIEA